MTLSAADKALRLTGIGGSDIGAICGLSRYRKPIDVWREKKGHDGYTESEPAIWGQLLEAPIACEYSRRHDDCYLGGPYPTKRTDVARWHLMSPDRIVATDIDNTHHPVRRFEIPHRSQIVRLIEIKTANWYSGRSFGVDGSDDLPLAYMAQVAWYLAGLDIEHATVAALINTSDYREFHVGRDTELEGYLLERGEAFWKLVESNTPPDPDGSESFKRYLQTRFNRTTEIMIPSSPDIEELAKRLRGARAVERAVKKHVTIYEQQLQNAIGSADGVEIDGGKITYKFDSCGKVRPSGAIEDLMSMMDWDAKKADQFLDDHRGPAPRRFIAPRAWGKDEPIVDIRALIAGVGDE